MTLPRPATALAACAAALLAACASTPTADPAAWEATLAPWRGASEGLLRSQWGPPTAERDEGTGRRLTYVTRHGSRPSGATVGIGLGGFGFGGSSAVGGGVGVSAPLATAGAACTTHFQVERGVVQGWAFEGPGCGVR